MNEWVKTLLTSTVVAGAVSWLTTSYKVDKELHSRQGEEAYEALVKANAGTWLSEKLKAQAAELKKQAEPEQGAAITELMSTAQTLERESYKDYVIARHKIAAFGDKRVVRATSDYWAKHKGGAQLCDDQKRSRADAKIYAEIRDTWGVGGKILGVGGYVSDEQLTPLLFECSLTEESEASPPAAPP